MKVPVVMALIALGMTLVVLATFFIDVPSVQATADLGTIEYPCCGQIHEEINTMLIAGSGTARGAHMQAISYVYGALILAFLVCCLLLGLRRKNGVGRGGKLIIGGAVLYFVCYAAMMLSYGRYLTAGSLDTFGALPVPTAWMLYAIWPAPFVFLALFVFGFRRFVWDDESEREFQRILADKRAAEEHE